MLIASILRGWDGHTWIYRGSIIKLSLNNYLRFESCKITHYKLEDKLKFIFISVRSFI